MPAISAIISAVLSALGFITKNPFLQKMVIFSFFFAVVSYTVDFFLGKASNTLVNASQILTLASYLGFLNALKVVFNFLIAGFIAKQILAFVRS
ncbi:hypothetical protein [Arcobacter arenosus]|jgi:hypothetical protein|uniref:DUF2523 domain-containing protein n=1 Tax=Arcobacter arenosus TaxID=2576037 RepID=A0A5R8XZC7_9BACT|nr:hypothetical protein [Arcobacter arenosus]TLP36947.1 hypothetical protein FDK22_11935 [Arcobacter arenosus]